MNSKSLNNIVINVVDSQDTFDGLVDAGKVNENELWLVQGESTSGSGKAYIGTCDTAQQTAYKIVACQDFELDAGAIIFVKFTYAHVAGVLYLNVNGTGNVQVTNAGETGSMASLWKAGEVVQFVYDGTNWLMIDHVKAGIYNAGIVQLSNSTTSNVETTAATSKAVKAAFDNGGVQSVNGSTGAVTISVPTKTSDLTNDSGFITSAAVPSKVSELTNDSGFITSSDVTDEKVKMTSKESFGAYPILYGDTNITSGNSYGAYYTTSVAINPSGDGTVITGGIQFPSRSVTSTLEITGYNGDGTTYATPKMRFQSSINNSTSNTEKCVLLQGIADPKQDTDAANRRYVDAKAPSITPSLSSGTAIATISQNGSTTTLYAPSGGSSASAVIISEEYTFPVAFDAGTIGTRGSQESTTISKSGYKPISVVITYVGASASYMPVVFLGGTNNNTLYCNAYRSTASAVSNSSIRATVFYALDDGNAVSLNTYNGEIE